MRPLPAALVVLALLAPAYATGAGGELYHVAADGPGWALARVEGERSRVDFEVVMEANSADARLTMFHVDENGRIAGGSTWSPDRRPIEFVSVPGAGVEFREKDAPSPGFRAEDGVMLECPCGYGAVFDIVVIATGDVARWSVRAVGNDGAILASTQGADVFDVPIHASPTVASAGAFGNDVHVGFRHHERIDGELLGVYIPQAGARTVENGPRHRLAQSLIATVEVPGGVIVCNFCLFGHGAHGHGPGDYTFRLDGEVDGRVAMLFGADVILPG